MHTSKVLNEMVLLHLSRNPEDVSNRFDWVSAIRAWGEAVETHRDYKSYYPTGVPKGESEKSDYQN